MRTLGIILLVAGIIMTVFTGFSYIRKEKVIDLGAVEVSKDKRTPVYWSPITGGILIATGIVVLLVGDRKRV
jgi:hypothetical protein